MTRPRFLTAIDESTPEPVEIKRWWITGYTDAQVHKAMREAEAWMALHCGEGCVLKDSGG